MAANLHFNETVKQAYSHGLEAIYALEAVDPSSIRIFTGNHQHKSQQLQNSCNIPLIEENEPQQQEFDLGPSYRNWIPPFFPNEPIQVLHLSLLAEKMLLANGKTRIADLIAERNTGFSQLKGIGQGHIDEIHRQLDTHIRGRNLHRAYTIDFQGWIQKLFGAMERKKVKVFLDRAQLGYFIELTPSEANEVKRLTPQTKKEWIDEVQGQLSSELIKEDFSLVIDAFVRNWMCGRSGLSTEREIFERLENAAVDPEFAFRALPFLQETFFSGQSPIDLFLCRVEKGVYAANSELADRYNRVLNEALTYFYSPNATYRLDKLMGLLLNEFGKQWDDLTTDFLLRSLRLSTRFRVRKGLDGHQFIQLSEA